MGRNFTDLKKNMTKTGLDNFCKKITEEYANSDGQFAQSYFCKQYDITKSCYDKVKDYAMVNGLVDDKTINKIKNKAIANQKMHAPTAGKTTINKTLRIYWEREEKTRNKSTEEKIKEFVELYALNPDKSKADLAKEAGYTVKQADSMIFEAITKNIVDDEIVALIEERSVKNSKPENSAYVKNYFKGLRTVRKGNKEGVTF